MQLSNETTDKMSKESERTLSAEEKAAEKAAIARCDVDCKCTTCEYGVYYPDEDVAKCCQCNCRPHERCAEPVYGFCGACEEDTYDKYTTERGEVLVCATCDKTKVGDTVHECGIVRCPRASCTGNADGGRGICLNPYGCLECLDCGYEFITGYGSESDMYE